MIASSIRLSIITNSGLFTEKPPIFISLNLTFSHFTLLPSAKMGLKISICLANWILLKTTGFQSLKIYEIFKLPRHI